MWLMFFEQSTDTSMLTSTDTAQRIIEQTINNVLVRHELLNDERKRTSETSSAQRVLETSAQIETEIQPKLYTTKNWKSRESPVNLL